MVNHDSIAVILQKFKYRNKLTIVEGKDLFSKSTKAEGCLGQEKDENSLMCPCARKTRSARLNIRFKGVAQRSWRPRSSSANVGFEIGQGLVTLEKSAQQAKKWSIWRCSGFMWDLVATKYLPKLHRHPICPVIYSISLQPWDNCSKSSQFSKE